MKRKQQKQNQMNKNRQVQRFNIDQEIHECKKCNHFFNDAFPSCRRIR